LAALGRDIEGRSAFQSAADVLLRRAARNTVQVAQREFRAAGHALPPDGLTRVRREFTARVGALVDSLREESAAQRFSPQAVAGSLARLDAELTDLVEKVPARLIDELELIAAVDGAGARFAGLKRSNPRLSDPAAAAIGGDFRREWVTARYEVFQDGEVDVPVWLEHEQAMLDRFTARARRSTDEPMRGEELEHGRAQSARVVDRRRQVALEGIDRHPAEEHPLVRSASQHTARGSLSTTVKPVILTSRPADALRALEPAEGAADWARSSYCIGNACVTVAILTSRR
jgi:hypothetical protein